MTVVPSSNAALCIAKMTPIMDSMENATSRMIVIRLWSTSNFIGSLILVVIASSTFWVEYPQDQGIVEVDQWICRRVEEVVELL